MCRQADWTVTIGCAIALTTWSPARAQQPPPGSLELKETGVVAAAQQGVLQLKNSAGNIWSIMINRDTKVRVDGTAEADYLHPGVSVRFTAETDKKGALKEELHELEIYTPPKKDYGVFKSDEEVEKPLRALGDGGKFYIKGQVQNYKAGAFTLSAGNKKITGKLAANPSIKVNARDLSLAQAEDNVDVIGWYFPNQTAGPNKPGQATATDVTVTLAKPLSGLKKANKPTRPAHASTRGSSGSGSGSGKLPPVQDPFAPPAEKKK